MVYLVVLMIQIIKIIPDLECKTILGIIIITDLEYKTILGIISTLISQDAVFHVLFFKILPFVLNVYFLLAFGEFLIHRNKLECIINVSLYKYMLYWILKPSREQLCWILKPSREHSSLTC